MINMQSGYYDMDNNVVIGDNNSGEVVDVLNTTPFSVRDILNIANQNSADESAYQDALNSSDLFAQKLYSNNCSGGASAYGSSSAQYKR
jgi:hypothetical protein